MARTKQTAKKQPQTQEFRVLRSELVEKSTGVSKRVHLAEFTPRQLITVLELGVGWVDESISTPVKTIRRFCRCFRKISGEEFQSRPGEIMDEMAERGYDSELVDTVLVTASFCEEFGVDRKALEKLASSRSHSDLPLGELTVA
jgi:hypothetical protein